MNQDYNNQDHDHPPSDHLVGIFQLLDKEIAILFWGVAHDMIDEYVHHRAVKVLVSSQMLAMHMVGYSIQNSHANGNVESIQ